MTSGPDNIIINSDMVFLRYDGNPRQVGSFANRMTEKKQHSKLTQAHNKAIIITLW